MDDTERSICLGELHIIIAHIGAIGSFLSCSGIEEAWIAAEWYDSACLLREVLERGNMKRSPQAHEATLLAIIHLLIISVLSNMKDDFYDIGKHLFPQLISMRTEMEQQSVNEEIFKSLWDQLTTDIDFLDFEGNIQAFVDHKKEDKMFVFLMTYSNMVRHLLLFIEASRISTGEQHLDAAEGV